MPGVSRLKKWISAGVENFMSNGVRKPGQAVISDFNLRGSLGLDSVIGSAT